MAGKRSLLSMVAVLVGFLPTARGAIIVANGPSPGNTASFLPGQSVTTPTGGPWNAITFNFYDSSGSPEASGNLFILTSEYLGTPTNLSAATPGFLAQSAGTNSNQWFFNSSVTLNPNTTYWFVVDEQFSHTTGFGKGGTAEAGAVAYFADSATSNYFEGSSSADWDFQLQGSVVAAVPEPASLAIWGLGALGCAIAGYRRRRQAA